LPAGPTTSGIASAQRSRAVGALLVAIGAILAALLAWQIATVNPRRGCIVDDTPYLNACSQPKPGSPEHLAALRARIAADPGDSAAYIQLAFYDKSPAGSRLLQAATALAPSNPNVMALRASAALEQQDWPEAAAVLVLLAEYGDNPQAALALAQMIAAGRGPLLTRYLTAKSVWFPRVLDRWQETKAPFSAALPLVIQALDKNILAPETIMTYIRDLKAAGAWVDAYGLWLGLNGNSLPILYNASFDEPFQSDGFDWEIAREPPSHAGASIERERVSNRGSVLSIQFTGKPIPVPLARQYLYLGEGRYRVQGEYATRQLRMENGLAWAVKCSTGNRQAGRSAALADTAGAWRAFAFDFTVPPDCGLVASFQLETFAPFEAVVGSRGRAQFDNLSLQRVENSPR
jgi:hypothetical protein